MQDKGNRGQERGHGQLKERSRDDRMMGEEEKQ